jgi:hypothetical protein
MRKVPLVRRTPLKAARRPHRPWARADEDKVSPETYAYVMKRDGECVARKLDPEHRCEGIDGLDHVKDQARMGKRAPSDRWHLVRLCWGANVNGWASAHRAAERTYLSRVEPDGRPPSR